MFALTKSNRRPICGANSPGTADVAALCQTRRHALFVNVGDAFHAPVCGVDRPDHGEANGRAPEDGDCLFEPSSWGLNKRGMVVFRDTLKWPFKIQNTPPPPDCCPLLHLWEEYSYCSHYPVSSQRGRHWWRWVWITLRGWTHRKSTINAPSAHLLLPVYVWIKQKILWNEKIYSISFGSGDRWICAHTSSHSGSGHPLLIYYLTQQSLLMNPFLWERCHRWKNKDLLYYFILLLVC